MRRTRLLYWLLWWTWYIVRIGAIGGAVAFLLARFGQLTAAAIVAGVTLVLIVVAIIARLRELTRARVKARERAGMRS